MSLATLGEVLISLTDKRPRNRVPTPVAEDIGRRLIDLVRRGKLSICGLGDHTREAGVVRTAAKVAECDDRLDLADTMIVATAFACSDCRTLLTNDGKLIESRGLQELSREFEVSIRYA